MGRSVFGAVGGLLGILLGVSGRAGVLGRAFAELAGVGEQPPDDARQVAGDDHQSVVVLLNNNNKTIGKQ